MTKTITEYIPSEQEVLAEKVKARRTFDNAKVCKMLGRVPPKILTSNNENPYLFANPKHWSNLLKKFAARNEDLLVALSMVAEEPPRGENQQQQLAWALQKSLEYLGHEKIDLQHILAIQESKNNIDDETSDRGNERLIQKLQEIGAKSAKEEAVKKTESNISPKTLKKLKKKEQNIQKTITKIQDKIAAIETDKKNWSHYTDLIRQYLITYISQREGIENMVNEGGGQAQSLLVKIDEQVSIEEITTKYSIKLS